MKGLVMNSISNITRRDIINIFEYGYTDFGPLGEEIYTMKFWGQLELPEFLERLYHLEEMPNITGNYSNLFEEYQDRWQKDLQYEEVFENPSLCLDSTDKFLSLVCEAFHPEVIYDESNGEVILEEINRFLKRDDIVIAPYRKISGRPVYKAYELAEFECQNMPFSIRNRNNINALISDVTFGKDLIYKIDKAFDKYNCYLSSYSYDPFMSMDKALSELEQYYPLELKVNGKNVTVCNPIDFLKLGDVYHFFDSLELFSVHCSNPRAFQRRINLLFQEDGIPIMLEDCRITPVSMYPALDCVKSMDEELNELITESRFHYDKQEYHKAAIGIWAAMERLKTYYYTTDMDNKKKSAKKLCDTVSCGNQEIAVLFDEEFTQLTKIGNKYNIRHYERDRITISNNKHLKYLYLRCYTLVSSIMEILKDVKGRI